MSPSQEFGEKWEKILTEKLGLIGDEPIIRHSENDWNCEIDIEWNNRLIHCKAATSKKHKAHGKVWRNRYQFNFKMISNGDFVIAICVTWGEPVFFIIPVKELTKRGLYVTTHPLEYSGWAAPYRNNWRLLKNVQD